MIRLQDLKRPDPYPSLLLRHGYTEETEPEIVAYFEQAFRKMTDDSGWFFIRSNIAPDEASYTLVYDAVGGRFFSKSAREDLTRNPFWFKDLTAPFYARGGRFRKTQSHMQH